VTLIKSLDLFAFTICIGNMGSNPGPAHFLEFWELMEVGVFCETEPL
jgi:hypothetical protein